MKKNLDCSQQEFFQVLSLVTLFDGSYKFSFVQK